MQSHRQSMTLLQILKKKEQQSNELSTVLAGNKLALKEKEWLCSFCSGILTEQSICVECKIPVDLVCIFCGKKIMFDTHEFCYCQLEILVPEV